MGVLDKAARSVASTMVKAFVKNKVTIKRVAQVEMADGVLVPDPTEAQVFMSPPFAYSLREIDGQNVLRGDLRAMIDAKGIEGTGIDLEAVNSRGSDAAEIYIEWRSHWHKIVSVTPLPGGDELAAFEVQLRR